MKYTIATILLFMSSPMAGYWLVKQDYAEPLTVMWAWMVGFIGLAIVAVRKDLPGKFN